jgi:endonuclease/exonuclease/phosphatase family metal-dependent hydrolase
MPRTSSACAVFASYNMLDLFESGESAGPDHYDLVTEVIGDLDADVLAVQEIRAGSPASARARLRRLAADVGMQCVVPGSGVRAGRARTALAAGSRGYHCGLMWRAGSEVVPGSFRESGAGKLWHSAGWATFRFGGRLVRHGVFHATPFGRELRARENHVLLAMLAASQDAHLPLLVGADWNCESADRVRDEPDGPARLYEPRDPFAHVTWADDMVHQCGFSRDEHGARRHWVDRSAGEILVAAGLTDAAAALRAPWQPTVGYFPGDGYGDRGIVRRIDAIRLTRQVLPALRGYRVTDTALARRASDHLPVSVEYQPADIAVTAPCG